MGYIRMMITETMNKKSQEDNLFHGKMTDEVDHPFAYICLQALFAYIVVITIVVHASLSLTHSYFYD
jgi:hypothetical protein